MIDLSDTPRVPVAWGELFDKITILEIKNKKLVHQAALENISTELTLLRKLAAPVIDARADIVPLISRLTVLNQELWDLEDRIREKERSACFDAVFVETARSIYKTNDKRASIKREISLILGSKIMEEKNYQPY